MTKSITDHCLENNQSYSDGQSVHESSHPGEQPIQPAQRLAVVACMDARIDVEDLLGTEQSGQGRQFSDPFSCPASRP